MAFLSSYLGSSCLYRGAVGFSYASRTFTIPWGNLTRFTGAFPCPGTLRVSGTLAVD